MNFRFVHLSMSATNFFLFQFPSACNAYSMKKNRQDFWAELKRMICYNRFKRNNRTFKWYSEPPFIWCLPIKQEILNNSQIEIYIYIYIPWNQPSIFHPDMIAAALRSALSEIPCVSERESWRAMIPGYVFWGLVKLCRIVDVNNFWFPRRIQERL